MLTISPSVRGDFPRVEAALAEFGLHGHLMTTTHSKMMTAYHLNIPPLVSLTYLWPMGVRSLTSYEDGFIDYGLASQLRCWASRRDAWLTVRKFARAL
jgi:hypothetical protein